MPYYKIIIHAKNLDFFIEEHPNLFGTVCVMDDARSKNKVVGFYTTTLISANNDRDAKSEAMTQVLNSWKYGKFSQVDSAQHIELEVENIEKISMFSGLVHSLPKIPIFTSIFTSFPTKGFTFYGNG